MTRQIRQYDSLEERVNRTYERLLLLHTIAKVNTEEICCEPDDILHAMGGVLLEMINDLGPIAHGVPAAIANWVPPARGDADGDR